MSDNSLQDLYSDRILTLAANIPHQTPLAHSDGHGQKRSNMCGSTIGVDIAVTNGRITGFAQNVRACALGQASAAIFAAHVTGCDRDQVLLVCEQLQGMLSGGPVPDAPFDEYRILQAARDYPARHASIMLAPLATLAAFDAI